MGIPWHKLSADQFEELCSQLLLSQGYSNVRQIGGTGDRGRDIVADRAQRILGSAMRMEKWIGICKRYLTQAPSPSDLQSDIDWAGAHAPNGVLVFTPLTITSGTHDWLELKKQQLGFDLTVLDKTFLEHAVHIDPGLYDRFFGKTTGSQDQAPLFYQAIQSKRQHPIAIYTAGKMASEPTRNALAPWRQSIENRVRDEKVPVDLLHPEFVGCDHTGIVASSTVELDSYMINQSDAMIVHLTDDDMHATVAEAMLAHARQIPVDFFIHESLVATVHEGVGMMKDIYGNVYKTKHSCTCLVYADDRAGTVDESGYPSYDPLVRTPYWWLLTLFRESRRYVRFHVVNDKNWEDHMVEAIRDLSDA